MSDYNSFFRLTQSILAERSGTGLNDTGSSNEISIFIAVVMSNQSRLISFSPRIGHDSLDSCTMFCHADTLMQVVSKQASAERHCLYCLLRLRSIELARTFAVHGWRAHTWPIPLNLACGILRPLGLADFLIKKASRSVFVLGWEMLPIQYFVPQDDDHTR